MNRIASHRSIARAQHGASMLESLIAFVVLAASTLAVVALQGVLRLDGDLARQRSEALRIGEAEIEGLRAFATIAPASGLLSYDAIADAESTVVAANASYRVVRRIDAGAVAAAKAATVRVGWTDRSGAAREIVLASVIAGVDPAYAGALALGAGAIPAASRGAFGRSPVVPVGARDLGEGRSVWKPAAAATIAIVFDNASGAVVGTCIVAATTTAPDLSAADLAACVGARRLLIGGTIRFTSATPPQTANAAEVPPSVAVALSLAGGPYAQSPVCASEAKKTVRHTAAGSLRIDAVALDATPASLGIGSWDDSGDRFVDWHCIVTPRADGRWSGRVALVAAGGWTIGISHVDRRVCSYVADVPRDFADVATTLASQNFLVVRGDTDCPLATVAHQP